MRLVFFKHKRKVEKNVKAESGAWKWSFCRNGKTAKAASRKSHPKTQAYASEIYSGATETRNITSQLTFVWQFHQLCLHYTTQASTSTLRITNNLQKCENVWRTTEEEHSGSKRWGENIPRLFNVLYSGKWALNSFTQQFTGRCIGLCAGIPVCAWVKVLACMIRQIRDVHHGGRHGFLGSVRF